MARRLNIRAILANPVLRKRLFCEVIIATQAREGIVTTWAQAEAAYRPRQPEAPAKG